MTPHTEHLYQLTRRHFLANTTLGLGAAALASLTGTAQATSTSGRGLPELPHFAPRIKRVIYLMQSGAPSHVDLFDYKPLLEELRGQEIPAFSISIGNSMIKVGAR